MRQARAPGEVEQIYGDLQALQWCKLPKGADQIKQYGVTENTQTKQTKLNQVTEHTPI